MRHIDQLLGFACNAASDAIALTDGEGRVLYVNQAFTELYGYTLAELDGRDWGNTLAATGSLASQTEHRRKDGSVFPVAMKVTRVEIEGHTYGICILANIGARRDAEERAERLRQPYEQASQSLTGHPVVEAILDTVPAIVWVAHDPECRVITGNRAGEQLLQAAPGSNLSKSASDQALPHFQVFKNGAPLPPERLPVQRAARGEVIADEEIELRFSDGSNIYIQGNAVPLRDPAGTVIGAVGAFLNVTRRREEQVALAKARDAAERAVGAKARFLAAASHDLRQPLQGLVLMHEVLAGLVSGEQVRILDGARKCASALCEMVDSLLDVTRLETGIVIIERKEHRIGQLIADVLPGHQAAAAAKGLKLRHVPSSLVVRTDPTIIHRMVSNLVSNAIKYTEQGGVVVGCRRRRGAVRIEVWDSGIGIPADQVENVFEEFHQLGNPERSRDKGSGLGLAIVDRCARLLGTSVAVSSQPGRGSCFAIDLPLVEG